MDTRSRLKRIINESLNGCPSYKVEKIVERLIANGVTLPPDDDRIEKIETVCESVLSLSERDFTAAEEMAQSQCNYIHPLKPTTTMWQQTLGRHNLQVIRALKTLWKIIRKGEEIQPPTHGRG